MGVAPIAVGSVFPGFTKILKHPGSGQFLSVWRKMRNFADGFWGGARCALPEAAKMITLIYNTLT